MITFDLSGNFYDHKKAAYELGLLKGQPISMSKPQLYRIIAAYIGLDVSDIPVMDNDKRDIETTLLCSAIREHNDRCCDVIIENKPVLQRPKRPVAKPGKQVMGGLQVAIARPRKTPKPILKVKR